MTVETYWRKLQETGWLDYLPQEMHSGVRLQLKKNLRSDPRHAFMALVQGGLDWDCYSAKAILDEFVEIAGDTFRPINVRETTQKKKLLISFSFGGKKYTATIPNDPGSIWEMTLSLANKCLAANNVEQRFIVLPSGDSWNDLVFVPPTVYERACEAGLVLKEKSGGFFVGADENEAKKIVHRKLKGDKWQGKGPQWPWWRMHDCDLDDIHDLLSRAIGRVDWLLPEIHFDSLTGVSIHLVPDATVERLSKFPTRRMRQLVRDWLKTSSVKDYCDDVEFLSDMFAEVCSVAQQTRDAGKSLLVCFGDLGK